MMTRNTPSSLNETHRSYCGDRVLFSVQSIATGLLHNPVVSLSYCKDQMLKSGINTAI